MSFSFWPLPGYLFSTLPLLLILVGPVPRLPSSLVLYWLPQSKQQPFVFTFRLAGIGICRREYGLCCSVWGPTPSLWRPSHYYYSRTRAATWPFWVATFPLQLYVSSSFAFFSSLVSFSSPELLSWTALSMNRPSTVHPGSCHHPAVSQHSR
jgi:hypothetical protein